jgi:hypothetical protein
MSASPSEPKITTAIIRRADRYVEMLEQARLSGSLRTKEADLLDEFERYTADILDRYWPAGPSDRESLAFAPLYEPQVTVTADDGHRPLITALMAADVESRGPLRLTQAQNSRLAEVFERIGRECQAEKLLLHAALAFDRAASLYLLLGNSGVRDRCLFARTQCLRTAMKPGWAKALATISWVLCGYGYRPYRLLLWVTVQLAVFSTSIYFALALEGRNQSIGLTIYECLTNYLNPLAVNDTRELTTTARVLLVTESYLGSVSLSVFFALLVRRWFRT